MASSKFKIRISYNSPVILTFCIICVLVFVLDKYVFVKLNLINSFFMVPGSAKCPVPFNFKSVLDYVKLFTHVLGHVSWGHVMGNLSFILLLGPLLEERYGSPMLALMMTVTALVTGVLNACIIPSPLLGSSGIAFMLIILASFTAISKNEIPLSFIFVFILFFCSELFIKKESAGVSVLAHIAGGLCGSMFCFLVAPSKTRARSPKKEKTVAEEDEYASNYRPAKNNRRTQGSDSEETIIGTIEL
nr:rhomboid family intramembrane serine protease [uncultured Treponema sp.]